MTNKEVNEQERRMTQEHTHTDSGVTVIQRGSGRINKVRVTYAEH